MLKSRVEITGQITPRNEITGQINTQIKVITPTTQEKEITPTKEVQEVIPDENIFALSKVKVNAIPDEYVIPKVDTKTITLNGTYNASDDNLDGYSNVIVEVEGKDLEMEESFTCLLENKSLENFKFPPLTKTQLRVYAFYGFSGLKNIEVPANITWLDQYTFAQCTGLSSATFLGALTGVSANCFYNDVRLAKLIMPNLTKVPTLGSNALYNTPIAGNTTYNNGEKGIIYVPDTLVDSFKTASGWKNYATQIRGISEL